MPLQIMSYERAIDACDNVSGILERCRTTYEKKFATGSKVHHFKNIYATAQGSVQCIRLNISLEKPLTDIELQVHKLYISVDKVLNFVGNCPSSWD